MKAFSHDNLATTMLHSVDGVCVLLFSIWCPANIVSIVVCLMARKLYFGLIRTKDFLPLDNVLSTIQPLI